MQIVRKIIEQLTEQQKNALNAHSLFTSIPFSNLWRTTGGTPVWWLVEENESFVILPGIEYGVSKLKRFQSMTDGLYANFVASEKSLVASFSAEILTAIANYDYAKVFLFDFQKQMTDKIYFKREELTTIIVDIRNDNWIPPDKKLQSEIRKSEREGVCIEKFDVSKHLDKFLELMIQTEKRHGRKPKYTEQFYIQLAESAKTDDRILWFWCEHEGKPVASHINFAQRNMLFNWQVFYDKKYSYLKANQKMIYKLVQNNKDESIEWLNLGASPPDAESLVDYKMKYGGEIYKYDLLTKKNLVGKIL